MSTIISLIRKDLYVLKKQLGIFLLVLVVFSLIPGTFSNGYVTIYIALLPMTALAYDERSKWNQLALAMPYSPRDIVVSKYCLGYLLALLSLPLMLLSNYLTAWIRKEAYSVENIFFALIMTFLACLILAINLPLCFRFGTEKSRLIHFATIFVAVFVVLQFAPESTSFPANISLPNLLWTVIAISGVLNFLSILLSTRFLRKTLQ